MKQNKLGRILRRALCLGEMLNTAFPVDEELLGKMILAKSIGMIAGPRGGGKSWLAMLIAYSIAGKKFLDPWGTGSGVPVAILDGEMRAAGFQERLRLLHAHNRKPDSITDAENNLFIISRDHLQDAVGSIDTVEGQERIDELIPSSVAAIIVDNLSAWSSGGREDSNSWATVKNWLIQKRLQGVAVLLIHHTGKNGQQRGSSAHEDLLDYSILLSPLPSSTERHDTRFMVDHTKLRDHIPGLKQKYEYSIWTENEELQFEVVLADFQVSAHSAEMLRLRDEGLTYDAIGKKLGINKSTVGRTLKKLRELPPDTEDGVTT